MKNKSKIKAVRTMSYNAFAAHASRHTIAVKDALQGNGAQGMFEVFLKNPLGLVSVLGLTNELGEDANMFMVDASFSFAEKFGKFENLCSDRYLSVLIFMYEYCDDLKQDPENAMKIKNECYEWLFDPTGPIDLGVKSKLNETLYAYKAVGERNDFEQIIPLRSTVPSSSTTFKL